MQLIFFLLALYVAGILFILPFWTIKKIAGLSKKNQELKLWIGNLEYEIRKLRAANPHDAAESKPERPATPPVVGKAVPPPPVAIPPAVAEWWTERPEPPPPKTPAPAGNFPVREEPPGKPFVPEAVPTLRLPEIPEPEPVAPAPQGPTWFDSINWEQFMGAKLFAWLGGLALFLALAFFVKYSFEHDLIPPALRVAIGFVLGAGFVVGGLKISREKYAITSQTLMAVGIVSLYAVTFSCRSIYHFEFFGPVPTFLLMSLITATAFILAVRLEAQVIAILGILGGFLTPALLSTGVDNPAGLFGYIAVLDLGLAAVALHRRWFYLVPLGAAGTVIMMAGWAGKFFVPEKTLTAMAVNIGFCALFIGTVEAARRLDRSSSMVLRTAIALTAIAFCFAWYFLGFPGIASRTTLFFGYIILISAGVFFLAWRERQDWLVAGTAGISVLMLMRWTSETFSGFRTPVTMTACLVFCAIYLSVYLFARRRKRGSQPVLWAAVGLPAVALGFAAFFLGSPEAAARTGLFFSFVFVVSLFLFVLAWLEGQGRLIAGVAGITALLMIRWAGRTFRPEQAPVVVTVCLVFCAIYFVVYLIARHWQRASLPVLWAAVGLPFVNMAFALFLMKHHAVSASPGLLFLFIVASDGFLLLIAWLDDRLPKLHLVAGLTVFGLLSTWTAGHLNNALLPWALAIYLVFAALHTVFPLLLERKRPASAPTWWSQLFPPLALLLMLLPIFKLESVSFLLWPAILLVDLIAVGLAVLSASTLSVAAVLFLTLVATGLTLFRIPVASGLDLPLLLVIGGFTVFFFAASLWLARRPANSVPASGGQPSAIFGDPRVHLPAFASLLPFLLLIMACARLSVPDPSAVFGLGLLLVVLTLGLTVILLPAKTRQETGNPTDEQSGGRQAGVEWLPACSLAGLAALELVWHSRHFSPAAAGGPLAWYIGFYAVFAGYPFLFRRGFSRFTAPWAVAAMSGLAQFWMVYQAIKTGWPGAHPFLGAVPALFALAPLVSLVVILRTVAVDNPKRLNQLAWFGGAALVFITLIFPIQFERQWLTVAWALEGAALIWLFHRVPHPALRATGVVLLVTAFVRLALNPAVLGYHVRGDIAIFNWYLYAYGLATAALFVSARLLAPPRQEVLGLNAPPLLSTLGTILAFLLLNIEIADFFTAPEASIPAFKFSGNFARDMSYTIGWALFALGLLAAGIWQKARAARYAAIALLSVALLKLFFHDLARLEALYRIGALLAVAMIAMLASFAYQRFLPNNENSSS